MFRSFIYTAVALVIWIIAVILILATLSQTFSFIKSLPEYLANWNDYNAGKVGAKTLIIIVMAILSFLMFKAAKRSWSQRNI